MSRLVRVWSRGWVAGRGGRWRDPAGPGGGYPVSCYRRASGGGRLTLEPSVPDPTPGHDPDPTQIAPTPTPSMIGPDFPGVNPDRPSRR
jgi:hypothetical protein